MATNYINDKSVDQVGLQYNVDQVKAGNQYFTGTHIDLDSTTATTSSFAATVTKWSGVITTEVLTTAAGASQAVTLTLSGVASTDLAFVTISGGSNTVNNVYFKAVCGTNTVTVTFTNNSAGALNGTLIFNYIVMKA